MNYSVVSPPFEIKHFEMMNKKEARQHLEWYKSIIPERLELLRRYFDANNSPVDFDFSINSLKLLWTGFVPQIKFVQKNKEELTNELKASPIWMHDFIDDNKISLETLAVACDIAIYFGEVFIQNHENIYWGVVNSPKTLNYVNRPVIIGFKNKELDPRRVVINLIYDVSRGDNNPAVLQDLYYHWIGYLK